jgi:hypothetical protein
VAQFQVSELPALGAGGETGEPVAINVGEPQLRAGDLEVVYVDTGTDLPSFGPVKVGMPTRHWLVFVPLGQATVGPGYLKVCYMKKQVKDAPSIGTDGELPAGDEEEIFRHYGMTYEPGAGGERRLARR